MPLTFVIILIEITQTKLYFYYNICIRFEIPVELQPGVETSSTIMERHKLDIRVYVGPTGGALNKGFSAAFNSVKLRLEVERDVVLGLKEMSNEYLRNNQMTVNQFGDWLAAGNIHILLNHPTLSISNYQSNKLDMWTPWDLSTVTADLSTKLVDKIGWPNVKCPVVMQEKIEYKTMIKALCTPFLVIKRTENGLLSREVKGEIFE